MRGQAALYDQSLLSYGGISRTSSAVFWIKRKQKYEILKKILTKNGFPQSPKSTKKHSFKYKGYKSVINIAQNF